MVLSIGIMEIDTSLMVGLLMELTTIIKITTIQMIYKLKIKPIRLLSEMQKERLDKIHSTAIFTTQTKQKHSWTDKELSVE